LEVPVVEAELRGEQPFAHPHFWAAFILIGDPGTSTRPTEEVSWQQGMDVY
jgi:hypothetical protein